MASQNGTPFTVYQFSSIEKPFLRNVLEVKKKKKVSTFARHHLVYRCSRLDGVHVAG